MAKHYETVFILTPVLSEAQVKETVDKFKEIITKEGGKIDHHEAWGLKKFAYTIQKKSTGFYHLLQFSSDNGEIIEKLELSYRRDEKVMRYLTVAMDKFHLEFAEKRRAKMKKSKAVEA